MLHREQPKSSERTKKFSRELRARMTVPERMLWHCLRNRRLGGLKFRRQQPIGPYIADFFCESASLVVELDGHSHANRGKQDAERDHFMQARGVDILRIPNTDLLKDRAAVECLILSLIESCNRPLQKPKPRGDRN
ncbi:MAG TPA: DUF559 domain-containing protein [Phycisphaerae bacterium]|nr:DUF559 domain-containing protein [Phycisphaerae bacterium]